LAPTIVKLDCVVFFRRNVAESMLVVPDLFPGRLQGIRIGAEMNGQHIVPMSYERMLTYFPDTVELWKESNGH